MQWIYSEETTLFYIPIRVTTRMVAVQTYLTVVQRRIWPSVAMEGEVLERQYERQTLDPDSVWVKILRQPEFKSQLCHLPLMHP